jgi:hypothetical protein
MKSLFIYLFFQISLFASCVTMQLNTPFALGQTCIDGEAKFNTSTITLPTTLRDGVPVEYDLYLLTDSSDEVRLKILEITDLTDGANSFAINYEFVPNPNIGVKTLKLRINQNKQILPSNQPINYRNGTTSVGKLKLSLKNPINNNPVVTGSYSGGLSIEINIRNVTTIPINGMLNLNMTIPLIAYVSYGPITTVGGTNTFSGADVSFGMFNTAPQETISENIYVKYNGDASLMMTFNETPALKHINPLKNDTIIMEYLWGNTVIVANTPFLLTNSPNDGTRSIQSLKIRRKNITTQSMGDYEATISITIFTQ